MASMVKMLGLAMLVLVPGGLLVLGSYFLARTVHHLWSQQPGAPVRSKLYHAMAGVRFRDLVRQVRATF